MKKYIELKLSIVEIEAIDVITTSNVFYKVYGDDYFNGDWLTGGTYD